MSQAVPAEIQVSVTTTNPALTLPLSIPIQVDTPTVYHESRDGIGTMKLTYWDPSTHVITYPTSDPNILQLYGAAKYDTGALWGIY